MRADVRNGGKGDRAMDMKSGKTVRIFDTTLRDGEQAPGCSMNHQEKLEVALALEALRVDTIEAGFAIASPGDFESVKQIARQVRESRVASLSRAVPADIHRAWEALRGAQAPVIHTFLATSPIHMEYKLKMTPDEVLEKSVEAVKLARSLCPEVEFSAEDASRSDRAFLCRVFAAAIAAGATTINIPDTVGYATPDEFGALVAYILANTKGIEKAVVSTHCHDDLGLAVANSLAAVKAGATQVECTVNGIGERAGNAALEEIAMALKTRHAYFGAETRLDTKRIYRTSRLVTAVTGAPVQINKAVVGQNAFAHESGIHQHGVLANALTYEIMSPESVGVPKKNMVLGKHSGRHAFESRIQEMGYAPTREEIDVLFAKFKDLADRKRTVTDRDVEALLGVTKTEDTRKPGAYRIERFVINSGNTITATATVRLVKDGFVEEQVATGDGPVDAMFTAINRIVGVKFVLTDYSLHAVTEQTDAQGEATIKIRKDSEIYNGRGVSTDVLEATAQAYVNAINHLLEAEGA